MTLGRGLVEMRGEDGAGRVSGEGLNGAGEKKRGAQSRR
jgi:hypothetical protein